MNRRKALLLAASLTGIGILLLVGYLLQPITIRVNGEPIIVRSFALTPGRILLENGFHPTVGDVISPSINSFYLSPQPIQVQKISAYTVFIDNQLVPVYSPDPIPANVLKQLGVELYPQDVVTMDGLVVNPHRPIRWRSAHTLQVLRSFPAMIRVEDGEPRTISLLTADPQKAIWQIGLGGSGASFTDIKPSATTAGLLAFELIPPLPESEPSTMGIAHNSVNLGAVYAFRGTAPQGLDRMTSEDIHVVGALPPVEMVRVDEQLQIVPKSLPFATRSEMDDNLDLDQVKTIQTGAYGVSTRLTRIRNENGKPVSEKVESETVIQPPEDEVIGYGTKLNVRTMSDGGVTFEYYRAINMYASSYSPCNLGNNTCNSTTASGAPARKGIVAVIRRWYNYMLGHQLYIPGYGFATIGDIGGGIPGEHWIDLGYSDEDYQAWHSYVTVYFLTPVPSNILYDLN